MPSVTRGLVQRKVMLRPISKEMWTWKYQQITNCRCVYLQTCYFLLMNVSKVDICSNGFSLLVSTFVKGPVLMNFSKVDIWSNIFSLLVTTFVKGSAWYATLWSRGWWAGMWPNWPSFWCAGRWQRLSNAIWSNNFFLIWRWGLCYHANGVEES